MSVKAEASGRISKRSKLFGNAQSSSSTAFTVSIRAFAGIIGVNSLWT